LIRANRVATNSIFLGVLSFLTFMTIGLLFSRTYFVSQTTDAEIVGYGVTYLSIVCIGSIGKFMQIVFERLLQATGKDCVLNDCPGYRSPAQHHPRSHFDFRVTSACPKMGVAGAAIATVIGQTVSAVLAIIFNLRVNKELDLSLTGFRPDAGIIKGIYAVGVPSIVMRSVSSVTTYGA